MVTGLIKFLTQFKTAFIYFLEKFFAYSALGWSRWSILDTFWSLSDLTGGGTIDNRGMHS